MLAVVVALELLPLADVGAVDRVRFYSAGAAALTEGWRAPPKNR